VLISEMGRIDQAETETLFRGCIPA